MTTLGDRMKNYEAQYEMKVPSTVPFILRLDGKSFSKFTKGFNDVFDYNFVIAMVRTMNDLIEKYTARTGYTHSDEITLIFPVACTKEEYKIDPEKCKHMFDGRIIKICTVVAGYCSTRFSYHINNIIQDCKSEYKEKFVNKISNFETCFDCRILSFDNNPGDIVNHMIWRSKRDCYRNCVSTFAQYYFGSKTIHGLNSDQMIEKLKKEKNLDWKDIPCFLKYGIYGKKELYDKECIDKNPKGYISLRTGDKTIAIRSRITNFNFAIYYDDVVLDMLLDKYFPTNCSDYNVPFYKIDIEDHDILIGEL